MNPEWEWWARKLAGERMEMNEGNPHAGFYRWPQRLGGYGSKRRFIPVAYWPDGTGELCCRVGEDDLTPEGGRDIWVSVGNHPVSEEAYRAVAEDGKPWPDEHPDVPMGSNMPPPDEDTFEGLKDQIENLAREAQGRLDLKNPVADQNEADQIANLADRLAELHKKGEALRKAERKPHDDELKRLTLKWSPVLTLAEVYKNLKYALLTPWLKSLEEQQKQEAEAAAAAGIPPAAEETARRPRVGTRGRAMTLKQQKKARITDYAVCLKFFEDSEDIRSCVQMLANRAVRAGITVPGTEVIEEQTAV